VLIFSEPFDQILASKYLEHNKKQFVNIVENISTVKNNLTKEIHRILGDKITDVFVTDRLIQHPCVITTSKNSISAELENAVNNVSTDQIVSIKYFEINMESDIIKKIMTKQDKSNDILLLYQLSMINAGYKIQEPSLLTKQILNTFYFKQ
jgi:HSP90 family molecular chaperone